MTTIDYEKKKYNAPSSWKDCNKKIYARLVPFSRLPKELLTDDFRMLACQLWLGISAKEWEKWELDHSQWYLLQQQFEWIWTPPTHRPFQAFEYKGQRYLLPEENFGDCSALEVAMAFLEYTSFAHPEEPDPAALDRLIATLCRPVRKDLKAFRKSADWNGDVREPYNEVRTLERSKVLSGLKMELKVVLLTYIEQMQQAFLTQYEQMFGGEPEPRYGDGRGWIMLLKNIAKEGHFGNFDQVCQQPVHLVFAAALDDTLTAEEIRLKQEQQNG